jgi:hypothetical protein
MRTWTLPRLQPIAKIGRKAAGLRKDAEDDGFTSGPSISMLLTDGSVVPLRTNCWLKSFLLAGLILPAALRADIIVNGGFETTSALPTTPGGILYNASPWVIVDPNIASESATGVCLTSSCGSPFRPHSGNGYFFGGAWLGSTGNTTRGTVSETVTTVPLASYEMSFWLAQPVAGRINSWAVSWDGIPLTLPIDGINRDVPAFPYIQLFFVVPGITGSDTVTFSFYDSAPAGQLAGYELDDVSITELPPGVAGFNSFSAIPEPGSGVLVALVLVLAGLGGLFRRRSAQALSQVSR